MNPCTIASCHGKPVCHECKALGYSPEENPLDMNETLLAINDALPKGSRLMACSTMAVILLGDEIPDPADLDACVRFLKALKATRQKKEKHV
jgi:hypothetical protein